MCNGTIGKGLRESRCKYTSGVTTTDDDIVESILRIHLTLGSMTKEVELKLNTEILTHLNSTVGTYKLKGTSGMLDSEEQLPTLRI